MRCLAKTNGFAPFSFMLPKTYSPYNTSKTAT